MSRRFVAISNPWNLQITASSSNSPPREITSMSPKAAPWRYQGDAILIRKLEDHEDPKTVPFDSVPIWVQFRGLPFYLLSKQLARNLGAKIGEFICIDNNARGDIADKILRARVHLPIARALQRWITLEDELTDDKVVVSVFYERLPSYCTCCGVIGHQADACELPATLRRTRYANNLSVPPTHRDDKRKWYLAESALENGRALQTDIPWRNVAALGPRRDQAPSRELGLVAQVVKEVQKLSVKDNNNSDMNGKGDTTIVTKPIASPADVAITAKPGSDTKQHKANSTATGASDINKPVEAKKGSWKRKARNEAEGEAEELADGHTSSPAPAVGGLVLGKRQGHVQLMQVDSKSENKKKRAEDTELGPEVIASDPGDEGDKAATSPGATGQLTGASVGAYQAP
jgi:hypothetical protein